MIHFLKSIAVYCIIFSCGCRLYAQPNITNVEYYLDNDPGYGNAIAISISPGTNLSNITTNINPATLSIGVHIFGIRAKDATGTWSLDNKWLFVKNASLTNIPNIFEAEYYIDTDPGFGKATPVSITPATNLSNLTTTINPATLSIGVHIFGIRAKDANGAWSLDNKWLFVKNDSAVTTENIIEAEYYIDIDPGYGKATAVNITPGTNLSNLTANINPASLSTGVHIFGIRARNANGDWSLDNKWLFVKDNAAANIPDIIRVEFYVDKDPGYGQATAAINTSSINFSDSAINLNTAALSDGTHIFGIRAKDTNGAWSLDNKWTFVAQGTLPIILTKLTGQNVKDGNELTAIIQQAINVKTIELERSSDGISYIYLGNVAVAPVTIGAYTYTDKNPNAGNNYYRLKITDNDGKINYSYVVLLNNTSQFSISAYPNPVKNNLTVHFKNAAIGSYSISVTNIEGKVMLLNKIRISENAQSGDANISFGRYLPGVYFVKVVNERSEVVAKHKIVKLPE